MGVGPNKIMSSCPSSLRQYICTRQEGAPLIPHYICHHIAARDLYLARSSAGISRRRLGLDTGCSTDSRVPTLYSGAQRASQSKANLNWKGNTWGNAKANTDDWAGPASLRHHDHLVRVTNSLFFLLQY